ncbi:MAG: hypothetical protein HY897_17535 [Deltaproteobacteria bacterium]|nr:hypothetical protein [Deltaproteobacteria bacterium]
MKRLLGVVLVLIVAFVCVSLSALAADVPRTIVVRGYLTDLAGAPVTKVVPMTYGIYKTIDGPESDLVLEETLGDVSVNAGVYFVELGKNAGLDAAFLGAAELFLEVRVEGTKMMPRQKIGSVPFSFVAQDAVGDIHPKSVTVGAAPVIDSAGKWVGDRSDIGTVKSVGTTAPLSGGPITDSGTISLPKADGTTSGYLASTDWAAFDAKQSRVTGVCNTGMSAVSVNLDGSLNCEPSYGGTVTSVGTGAGLAGGPVTATGTILLDAPYLDGSAHDARFVNEGQPSSVSTAMLQDGAVGSTKLAATYTDGSAYDARFVNAAGDTMTGAIGLPADGLKIGADQLVCKNGNLGLGVADPGSRLHVVGGGELGGTGVISSSGTTVTGVGTKFTTEVLLGDIVAAQGQKRTVTAITDDTSLTTDTAFSPVLPATAFTYQRAAARITDSTGSSQVVIDALGNMGVGTAVPDEKLTVNGNLAVSGTINGKSLSLTCTTIQSACTNDPSFTINCPAGYLATGAGYNPCNDWENASYRAEGSACTFFTGSPVNGWAGTCTCCKIQ